MKRILIVEDDEKIQNILREFLWASGYETLSAQDGVAGIARFREGPVDLILLDIMMPKMD